MRLSVTPVHPVGRLWRWSLLRMWAGTWRPEINVTCYLYLKGNNLKYNLSVFGPGMRDVGLGIPVAGNEDVGRGSPLILIFGRAA